MMKYIDDFSTGWLLMAFGCMILQLLVDAWLTCLIVRISCPDYSFGSGFKTMMVGQFYNSVTPMGVAAKPMQIYSLSRQRVSVGDASAAMVQKYLIYQFTLVFYSLGLLLARYSFFSRQIPDLMLLSAVGFLVQASIIVLLMLFSKSQKMTRTIIEMVFSLLKKLHLVKDPEKSVREISEQLESFHENFQTILRHKRLLVGSFLLTFLQMTLYYAVSYCIYRAFFLYAFAGWYRRGGGQLCRSVSNVLFQGYYSFRHGAVARGDILFSHFYFGAVCLDRAKKGCRAAEKSSGAAAAGGGTGRFRSRYSKGFQRVT